MLPNEESQRVFFRFIAFLFWLASSRTYYKKIITDNHLILRQKCEEEEIMEEVSDGAHQSETEELFNIHDQEFRQLLNDIGLLNEISQSSIEGEEANAAELDDRTIDEDYDVDELLTSTMIN